MNLLPALQSKAGDQTMREHAPTTETLAQVNGLARVGIRHDAIAKYLEIDPKTLRKHYRRELDVGKVDANVAVAGSLFALAMSGNVTACIFWLKTQAGWREKDPDDEEVREITVTIRDATGP